MSADFVGSHPARDFSVSSAEALSGESPVLVRRLRDLPGDQGFIDCAARLIDEELDLAGKSPEIRSYVQLCLRRPRVRAKKPSYLAEFQSDREKLVGLPGLLSKIVRSAKKRGHARGVLQRAPLDVLSESAGRESSEVPEERLARQEKFNLFRLVLMAAGKKARLLELMFIEGLSIEAASAKLGLSKLAAQYWLHNFRRRMQGDRRLRMTAADLLR